MRKTHQAFLDEVAPGWREADRPAQFVKTIDPKHRMEAAASVWWLKQNPPKTTAKKKPAKA